MGSAIQGGAKVGLLSFVWQIIQYLRNIIIQEWTVFYVLTTVNLLLSHPLWVYPLVNWVQAHKVGLWDRRSQHQLTLNRCVAHHMKASDHRLQCRKGNFRRCVYSRSREPLGGTTAFISPYISSQNLWTTDWCLHGENILISRVQSCFLARGYLSVVSAGMQPDSFIF